jgi:hypothetical protein
VIHGRQTPSVEISESVWRVRIAEERDVGWCRHVEDCLEERASSFLDKLAKRVKVSCEFRRRWEDSLAILALTLAKELFPPFADEVEARLERRQQFDTLSA